MPTRALRRQILLSTTMIVGALTGYASRAYAQGCTGGGGVYTCSGAATSQQTINATDATVSTVAGFSLNTGDTYGVRIIGQGDLSFTDTYNSNITATNTALSLYALGSASVGSITVSTTGNLSAGSYGLGVDNQGAGAVNITTGGDVTGGAVGIEAENYGTDLTITTLAGTTVTGHDGISAYNAGSGTTTITANGNVYGTLRKGISAYTSAGDLSVTTAAGTLVRGHTTGIFALGGTATTINAYGSVTGVSRGGIYATAYGSGLNITTGTGTVSGATYGIRSVNFTSGATTITVNGDVTGTSAQGIYAQNVLGTTNALTVTTAAGTAVSGSTGITALNTGTGTTTIDAYGDVTGTTGDGIYANAYGSDIAITVGSAATVTSTGTGTGDFAIDIGQGAANVTVAGMLTGGGGGAVRFDQTNAYDNSLEIQTGASITGDIVGGSGTDTATLDGAGAGAFNVGQLQNFEVLAVDSGDWTLSGTATAGTITTAAGSTVTGGTGINAAYSGSGALHITANGDVIGAGISADNSAAGTNLIVTTGSSATITGGLYGIYAHNQGSGYTTVTVAANGDVSGISTTGIAVKGENSTTDATVTTGVGSTVAGYNGIAIDNQGTGATAVTADGNVQGTNIGIGVFGSGTSTAVTTGAYSLITGYNGILADNSGSGPLTVTVNGDVDAAGVGIKTQTSASGGDMTVTVGASANVMATNSNGIQASGAGSSVHRIEVYGTVTSANANGISASGNNLDIVTGAGSTVTGRTSGIVTAHTGSGALNITTSGNVTGTTDDGIDVRVNTTGDTANIAVNAGSIVTSTGTGTDDFAIDINQGAADVMVAGTLTGGGGGAVRFDQTNAYDGHLEIQTGASITGDVLGGLGTDTLTLDGAGSDTFDMDTVQDFEVLAVDSGVWTLSGTATPGTITTAAGSTVTGGTGINAAYSGSGDLSITADGDVTGTTDAGIDATNNGTDLTVATGSGATVTGYTYGVHAYNAGSGATTIMANGNVTGTDREGINAANSASATDLSITTAAGTTVSGEAGIQAANAGSGTTTITANGTVTGTGSFGIGAATSGPVSITTGTDATIQGVKTGIFAKNYGTGATNITANGNVTGTNRDGIYAYGGTAISINVASGATVTSNSTDVDSFAIETANSPTTLTVAGTLNGGEAGAVRFDRTVARNDRLVLYPTAVINGNVFAGLGSDTLALGGSGAGTFDLGNIDTGAALKKFREFEKFAVDSGTWSFSGATTAAFTVYGGTVKGTGTFGGLTFDGGTLAPGNSIGTMTVNGAFAIGSGAVYEVEVNASGQSDKVVVKGTVNLTGATLRVLEASGNYNTKTQYTIIDNDGSDAVVGTFAKITNTLAFLTPFVSYTGGDGNDVVLYLLTNGFDFSSAAKTKNQRNVATALGQIPTDNALYTAVLNQTVTGARQSFDALSGEIHATVAGMLADDSRYVRDAILGRLMQASHTGGGTQMAALAAAGPQVASLDSKAMALGYSGKSLSEPAPSPLTFWTHAFGAWANFGSDGNAATANRNLGGFVSGMDAQVYGSWRAGLATGASFSNVNVDARYSSAQVKTYNLGGYLGGMAGSFSLRGGGMWAWSDVDTSRAVVFPGFYERQKAGYHADTGQIFGEAAYPMQAWGMGVEPFAGLAYVSVNTDNFHERGGSLASLNGRSTDETVGYTTVGLRAAQTMQWGAMQVTPHISAAWQHAFDNVTPDAALAFATTGTGFTVYGVPLAQDAALLDTGLDLTLGPNTTAGVSYSGQFGDRVTDNAVKGRFTLLF